MPRIERIPEQHMQLAYGIFLLTPRHRVIKTLRKRYQPSIHGDRTWGSSFLLMDYLCEHGMQAGSTVMEVGCGWGGASLFCAKRFAAKATGVDLDPAVFPYLELLADLNDVKVARKKADFTRLQGRTLGSYDCIIGGDICFWDNLVQPLVRMASRALDNGTQRIIIADPGRPTFYEFCDLIAQKYATTLQEWYAIEPERYEGEVVEVRAR
ncbi:MAG: methyltransferase domain-containing protein [Pseudomonadota bacterium]